MNQQSASNQPFRFFHNLNIGRKLALGFGIVLLLTAAITIFSLFGLRKVQTSYQEAIDNAIYSERLATQIESALLQARRREKDFFLRWQEEGFDTAYTNYVVEHQQHLSNVRQAVDELGKMVNKNPSIAATVTQNLDGIRTQVAVYDRGFQTVVGLEQQRGFKDSGFEGEFRAAAHALESQISVADIPNLKIMLLQLRRTEKDYLLRHEQQYIDGVRALAQQLKLELAATMPADQQPTLQSLVDDYLTAFEKLVATDQQIVVSTEIFRTAAHTIEPLVTAIVAVERDQAAKAIVKAQTASHQTVLIGSIGMILMLLLGLGLSYLLTRQIKRPIQLLARTAEQVGGGDLMAQAPIQSVDEIGMLAQTFNTMTGQLRHTMHSLEQGKRDVEQAKKRTDDLVHGIIPIGIALTAEKDFGQLLEMILTAAKKFCHADAGTLYLRTPDNHLSPMIMQNDSLNIAANSSLGQTLPLPALSLYNDDGDANHRNVTTHTAHTGKAINIQDVYNTDEYDFSGPIAFDFATGYQSLSLLTIPLKNSASAVIGVLQLVNARDDDTHMVTPFTLATQEMIESLSALATAALDIYAREQTLRQEIQSLRIEIDQSRRARSVAEITDSDFFRDLQNKARRARGRSATPNEDAANSA